MTLKSKADAIQLAGSFAYLFYSMGLATLLCASIAISYLLMPDLSFPLQELAAPVHRLCLNSVPQSSLWHSAYEALICGKRLRYGPTFDAFRQSGLLHLLVVSGAHLLFLERILSPLLRRSSFPFLLLSGLCIFYSTASLLHPPVMRALLSLHLGHLNRSAKLYWRKDQEVLYTGLGILFLFPSWIQSYSLALSWSAALGLAISLPKSLWSSLIKCLLIYLLLFPFLMGFAPQHPSTILVNWLIGPVIGSLLFPASLLATLIPPLATLTDRLWEVFVIILSWLSDDWPELSPHQGLSLPLLWCIPLTLHLLIHFFEMRKRRRICFACSS